MLIPSQNLATNLGEVRNRIRAATLRAQRTEDCVTLLAVSKGQDAAAITTLAQLGIRDFGENYLQEALPKLDSLASREPVWHFIGALQANKTRIVAERFAWVHTLDRLRIAERLSAQRDSRAPPLNVCVQVRIGDEATKAGVAPGDVRELLRGIAPLPGLRLRGLMCLPPAVDNFELQRRSFAELRQLRESLRAEFPTLDTLSMGMSNDLEAAILEGATIVRIGTALFGERQAAR